MSLEISAVSAGTSQVQTRTGPSATAPTRQKMTSLFNRIDTAGAGSITSAQFAQAFQTMHPPASFQSLGSGSVFAQLDPAQTGSVSKTDFVNTMSALSNTLRAATPPAAASDAATAAGANGIRATA